MKKLIAISLYIISFAAFASSSIDQTLQFPRIGDVAISPNGKQIAFTTSKIISVPHGKKRQFFLHLKDETGNVLSLVIDQHVSLPLFSPNGKSLAYLISDDKNQMIEIYDLQNQHTKNLISLSDRNLSAFKWSPDSQYIVFVANSEAPKKGKLLEPINVANDYQNSALYLISVPAKQIQPMRLTPTTVSITQSYIPALDGGFDWSPDGKTIAFAYQPREGADYELQSKIALLDLTHHKVIRLPYMQQNAGMQPIYSPDGQWLAFRSNLSQKEKLFYTDPINNSRICVMQTSNFATHCLANTPNEGPSLVGWAADSQSIYVLDWYKAVGSQIYQLSLTAKLPIKTITKEDGFIEPLALAYNTSLGIFAYGFETPQTAPEIYQLNTNPYQQKQITHLQSAQSNIIGHADIVHWSSQDKLEMEGVLYTPANFTQSKKYPLLVVVHGGPAGAFAKRYIGGCDEFGEMILPSCLKNLLDLGFVIFEPNYRGSTGYGLAFRWANVHDFGGGDYQDIMTGIDSLIAKGIADPDHLAIFGWSYGGYMTAWAVTQSNRFKAAVEGSGLTDLVSFSGTTDIPYYLHYYLESTLWDDSKLYLQRSPIFNTKKVTTPLLILQGQEDVRVPLSQSYEFYHALQAQHKNVQMQVYPQTGHILTDANIIYASVVATDEWLKQAISK